MKIWKDIDGYFGRYKVSNYGEIINAKTQNKLKYEIDKGYYRIQLFDGKKYTHHLVHRLVAKAFIQNSENLKCINHKDENKLNNCTENLEWCDHKYNANYGTRNNRISTSRSGIKVTPFSSEARINISKAHQKQIRQFSTDGEFLRNYSSIKEAGKENAIDSSSITKACKGKKKSAGGFMWQYAFLNGTRKDMTARL